MTELHTTEKKKIETYCQLQLKCVPEIVVEQGYISNID